MTCQSNFLKSQIQQNNFLRLADNYRMYNEINKMHSELNIGTVFDYVKNAITKVFNKISSHKNLLMRNLKVTAGRHKNVKHIME